jgi:hypothetical protein
MAVLSELERHLVAHYPRLETNQPLEDNVKRVCDERIQCIRRFYQIFTSCKDSCSNTHSLDLANVGTPKDGRFDYPSDKKLSSHVVYQFRKAETELDAFWAKFEEVVRERIGTTPEDIFGEHLAFMEERVLERTPEWVDPSRKLTIAILDQGVPAVSKKAKKKAKRAAAAAVPQSPADFNKGETECTWVKPLTSTINSKASEKKKAAAAKLHVPGIGTPPVSPIWADMEDVEVDFSVDPFAHVELPPGVRLPNSITVTKRAYKVLSKLFYTPAQRDRDPGEIAWTDFLQAMKALGCSAKRQVGTMWVFTADRTLGGADAGTIIVFHEPFPGTNLSIDCARVYGRRLKRRFGWSVGSFTSE